MTRIKRYIITVLFILATSLMVMGAYATTSTDAELKADKNLFPKYGWEEVDGNTYYYVKNVAQTGFVSAERDRILSTFYFNEDGVLQTGFITSEGSTYCFDDEGRMVKGFYKLNNVTYHFSQDGKMSTGMTKVEGSTYLFSEDGKMMTGLQKIGKAFYFFNTDGKMATGLKKVNKSFYFFGKDGKAVSGWQEIKGNKYYFKSLKMVTGEVDIDGKTYIFNSKGVCEGEKVIPTEPPVYEDTSYTDNTSTYEENYTSNSSNSSNYSGNTTTSNSGSRSSGTSKKGNTGSTTPKTTSAYSVKIETEGNVSDYMVNDVKSWVGDIPDIIREQIYCITITTSIDKYNIYGFGVNGVTVSGHYIYLNANAWGSGMQKSFYHESGHCLDMWGGYSFTSAWESICNSEWSGEGYYADQLESFAEAVGRYYRGTLNGKPQTLKAIKGIISTGKLTQDTSLNITLYAKSHALWVYDGPNDFYGTQIGTVQIGDSVKATALNADKSWYTIKYNGGTGYVRADFVSLEP